MAGLARFSTLPIELRLMIWEFAVPMRIIEVGEPCDPDIIPETDLRKAWLLNLKYPAIAHVCHESRQIALAKVKLPEQFLLAPDYLTDSRWWWKSTDVVHFNAPDTSKLANEERCRLQEDLLDLIKVPVLRKKVSISADLIHPFLRFRGIPDIPISLVWDVIFSLDRCIIALHTVCIRATKEDAGKLGLFGNGEEPAQLIDPFDKPAIQRLRELWNNTKKEVSAEKFFDTIDTKRFEFRVHRWVAEMAIEYIKFRWISPQGTNSGALHIIARLSQDPKQINAPDVQEYLVGCPILDLRILFRLCPPAVVEPVMT
ncbi:hypothetical protein N7457_009689 [Penicillium paradoxum]|uniref:uncharacterized protein n=1 Tax=Penicillium paradoxum TaxID=176176 RepID=UPI002548E5CA|nr:uncharacterized protein N7457_009689 [Penicillium paradoxum]KAJ5774793.1 hypothetical protein N7457_009689 [Penicillium paradoxum]